ncbi:hypothetical protein BWQ96_04052 [Gracilariopsis chorda]|uniref:Uncharacterized protein n=1 Tax=Gracilariopsis chorda TaxID=448386 RepID=A0A2V3IVR9_9FLOR|nr:hypothetical protein BWQ96_04052 [Gracilariopsis chorda]|eukprot:PXF46175.1 hypothetical protein BWQ96_04052 [Gracilariopsis chorda]
MQLHTTAKYFNPLTDSLVQTHNIAPKSAIEEVKKVNKILVEDDSLTSGSKAKLFLNELEDLHTLVARASN